MRSQTRSWPDIAAVVAAVLGGCILAAAVFIFQGSRGFGYDFVSYHAAAQRLMDGASLYLPDTVARYAAGQYDGLYLYPAPLALGMTPLALLPLDAATLAWMGLRIALLVVGCAILPVPPRVRLLTFAVACVSHAVLFDLNLGNVSLVTFGLTAVAWRVTGSWGAAIAHAALIAIRAPFGLFFLTWLVRGAASPILRTLVVGSIMIIASLPFVGIDGYLEYIAILRGLPDITTGPHNLSLATTGSALGLPSDASSALPTIGYVFGIAAVILAARRRGEDVALIVTALVTLVVTPFIHPHYLVLLLLPTAWLMARGHWWALVLPLTAWLPGPVLPLIAPAVMIAVLLLSSPPERTRTPSIVDSLTR
jgi:hypothetical protein